MQIDVSQASHARRQLGEVMREMQIVELIVSAVLGAPRLKPLKRSRMQADVKAIC